MIHLPCAYCSVEVLVSDGTQHAVCNKCFQKFGFTFGPRFHEFKAFEPISSTTTQPEKTEGNLESNYDRKI